jgi:hypothetical protein
MAGMVAGWTARASGRVAILTQAENEFARRGVNERSSSLTQ